MSETAAPWSRLALVHANARAAAQDAFARIGRQGFIMCHLSHSYHAGACLYFTFAFVMGDDGLAEYDQVKTAVQQSFLDSGATLSHHHAVGTEHQRWMAQDVSEEGVGLMAGLFAAADPQRRLNPGKILP